jgi:hypothetical protein
MSYPQQQQAYYGPPQGQYGPPQGGYPPPQPVRPLTPIASLREYGMVANVLMCLDVLRARPATATAGTQEGEGVFDRLVSLPIHHHELQHIHTKGRGGFGGTTC